MKKETDEKGNPLTYWGGLEEPKQETAVDWLVEELFPNNEIFGISNALIYQAKEIEKQNIIDACEKMYSDMQEYAEFCIECDRREMPLLLVQDWYEHFKKK
jgi:hypothetical protein